MISIQPATLADLDRLSALEMQIFASDRISRRQFRYLLTRANRLAYTVDYQGALAGYIILLQRSNSRRLRIYSIGVAADHRNLGIAKRLLVHAESVARTQHCTQITLEVCEHNSPAIQLYRAADFSIQGMKYNYYEDGCNALRLSKNLTNKDGTADDPPSYRGFIY